ncbi:MAG: hypothetical protein EBW66_05495 [Actinobacteria bacterium]|nr:hypothetical protein [Actinomycetota bacterium]
MAEKLNQKEVKFFKEMKSVESVVRALTIMENNNNREDVHEASYAIGQLMYEWVIAEYGLNGYRRIVENQIRVEDFSENIKISLGLSTKELYRKVAPHIMAGFKYGY